MRALFVVGAMFLAQPVFAQSNEKYTGSNVDVRTILSFKASDAAVQKMLPEGWEVNSPAAGPSKGANLGLSLIDQVTVQDAEGKPATTFRGAVFTIPAKKKGTDTAGTMVFTGLMSAGGAPGAYGVYVPAKAKVEREVETEADGKSTAEEKWEFKADDGSSIEVKIEYERGPALRNKVEAKVFSAAKPEFYRIYRFEQASDVARSTANGVDRVGKISVKGTGEKLSSARPGGRRGVRGDPCREPRVFEMGIDHIAEQHAVCLDGALVPERGVLLAPPRSGWATFHRLKCVSAVRGCASCCRAEMSRWRWG